jgi:hypothetical protein
MMLARRWRTLAKLERRNRLLLLEAYVSLGWARALLFLPFSRLAFALGAHRKESPLGAGVEEARIARRVSWAIHCASRHTPWESTCLVRAVAGLTMLRRRGFGCTLYLGTGRDEGGALAAHAWLRSGAYYVTGAEEMHRFTIVGTFAAGAAHRAGRGGT